MAPNADPYLPSGRSVVLGQYLGDSSRNKCHFGVYFPSPNLLVDGLVSNPRKHSFFRCIAMFHGAGGKTANAGFCTQIWSELSIIGSGVPGWHRHNDSLLGIPAGTRGMGGA